MKREEDPRAEYMRIYQREWLSRRRREWLEENGPCSSEETKDLVDEHVDPATKSVPISRIWSWSKSRREAELSKCQVLCVPCHDRKSTEEGGGTAVRHGTRKRYSKGCRCTECRSANAEAARKFRARRKERLAQQ